MTNIHQRLILRFDHNRYFAICHPLRALLLRRKVFAQFAILIIIIIAIVINLPESWQFDVVLEHDGVTNATFYNAIWNEAIHKRVGYAYVWPWLKAIISNFLPILLIIALNLLIVCEFRRSGTARKQLTQSSRNVKARENDESQLTVLLVTASVVFVIGTVPITALILYDHMPTGDDVDVLNEHLSLAVFRMFANFMETFNFAANFFAYGITNAGFRLAFKQLLCPCCKTDSKATRLGSAHGRAPKMPQVSVAMATGGPQTISNSADGINKLSQTGSEGMSQTQLSSMCDTDTCTHL